MSGCSAAVLHAWAAGTARPSLRCPAGQLTAPPAGRRLPAYWPQSPRSAIRTIKSRWTRPRQRRTPRSC